jgi:N6-L-threonylcarbamoyladenine synthase
MPIGPFPAIEPVRTSSRVLGIESSCDETASAVVEDGRSILSSVVASQVDLHAKYGGVFPEVASRQHILAIYPVVEQALTQAHLSLHDVDAIAVTRGPGLPGSLVIGMNTAKGLALSAAHSGGGLALVGINHLEAHLYSAWLGNAGEELPPEPQFPLVALIVSGGHSELVLMSDHLRYQRLGATLDDAAGEAFDKVARLLGLGYPGGPAIETASQGGDPQAFNFPRAWLENTWNFSFSGLKTAVLREVRQMEASKVPLPTANLAASFQAAVVEVLAVKTIKAVQVHKARSVLVVGGVSANRALREAVKLRAACPVHIPPLSLCTDNAAMVAAAGHFRFIAGQRDPLNLDVLPNWPLTEV